MAPHAETHSRYLRWRDAQQAHAWGTDPSDLDMDAVERVVTALRPVFGPDRAYFRTEVEGLDALPDRPVMLVGNHSGGTSIPDVWGLGVAWYRHFGRSRPLHSLAHEMVFAVEPVAERFARLGGLRASRSMARSLLVEHRRDMLVYPGGDLETWRPWSERYEVRFSGRTGYARTSILTGTPIVPVAHAGAHDTLVVLTDGQALARKLRLPELFRAHIFPVHLSLPFGLGIGPTPHLPPPCRLRYRVGAPVEPPAWDGEGDPPKALVQEHDRRVRAALQAELDALRDAHEGVRDRFRFMAQQLTDRLPIRSRWADRVAAK